MSVLVIAEHDNSNLKTFSLNVIKAASEINSDINVLVAGNKCENVCKEVAAVPLVKKVLQSDSIFEAALIAFKEKVFKFELSCSAITKTDIRLLWPHF